MKTDNRHRNVHGFTLAEVLLASVLGAMLLTALSLSTFGFTNVLSDLEAKAGVIKDIDPVLRTVTRDIREAQWAELVSTSHIRLADNQGRFTEYYKEGSDLMVRRHNGDTGSLHDAVDSLSFEAAYADRAREGQIQSLDGTWYQGPSPGTLGLPIVLPDDAELSIAFIPPVLQADVPGFSGEEEVLGASPDVVRLPLAWIDNDPDDDLILSIYESWGPGSAKPLGTPLGVLAIDGASLPPAVWNGTFWNVPSDMVSLSVSSLGLALQPGTGYTMVLSAEGPSEVLLKAHPFTPTGDSVDMAIKAAGGNWVTQMLVSPFEVSGSYQLTQEAQQSVITRFTISLTPTDRPAQTRSASLLSQTLTEDEWLGVVPGEVDP